MNKNKIIYPKNYVYMFMKLCFVWVMLFEASNTKIHTFVLLTSICMYCMLYLQLKRTSIGIL